jgi:NAD(P)-dependent dehydrogenase (short-subunit alcohol dehydrogenase family)
LKPAQEAALNPLDLSSRGYLVTGASSGIGRAVCQVLDGLGARLVLTGRDVGRLETTRLLLSDRGHHVAPFDLQKADEIGGWMRESTREFGPLRGFVHCAGVFQLRPVQFLTGASWRDVFYPNAEAAWQLVKAFRQKGVFEAPASIVWIASVLALVGQPATTAYAGSKGALVAMARSLALELAADRIRINCVAPGQVRTEMTERTQQLLNRDQMAAIERMHPLGLGESVDVAHAVAFLLADTGRWITGTTLVVDGGYTAQ